MGFEVYYHYNEKLEDGYDKSELKTLKKRIGDPFEDVSLDKLAASITAQLARRDIFISEVEVYELSKKKISFKETKGGIVIKNKKFLFDSTEATLSCVEQDSESDPSPERFPEPHTHTAQKVVSEASTLHPHEILSPPRSRRAIDSVVFAPEPHHIPDLKRKNLSLTIDKKYEVFEKKPSPNGLGEMYLIVDDRNKDQLVPDLYFIPGSVNLFGDKELDFSGSTSQREGGNLLWGDAKLDSGMPDIRRR